MNGRAVELPLLYRLPAQTLVLDVSDLDWRRVRREVRAFLDRTVGVNSGLAACFVASILRP